MSHWKILHLHRGDMAIIDMVSRWTFDAWGGLYPRTTFEEWRGETREDCGARGVPSVFVATVDDEPVGTASLTASDMSIRPGMGPWLASVFVGPAWRGYGIASALVARVEAEARAVGVQRLHLYTPDQMALYARLGWVCSESLVYRGVPVSLMHRDL